MTPKRRLTLLALLAALPLAASPVLASSWPERPVRVVVGFAPGGPTDLVARLVARHLADAIGQQVIVENKAGAAGNIATQEAAAAKPDGYTALVAGINLTINPWMTDDLKVDSRKDFIPVRLVATMPTVLVVRNNFPATDFKAFLAEVRANPDRYSSAAPGSSPLLATELFSRQTGGRIVPVPYKGAAPAMVDLIAGHVDVSFATLGSVMSHIKSGKVRALAIATPERDPELPDVQTFAENGMADFRFDAWTGLLMPAGTPAAIVERLDSALAKAVRNPEFDRQLRDLGMKSFEAGTPAHFSKTIADELQVYQGLAASVRGKAAR